MALSELEQKRVEHLMKKFIEKHRPPPHIRAELDIGFRLAGQSVEIFEVRPKWDGPSVNMEHPVAKATFLKTREPWKMYWMRQDLKWHGYDPEVNTSKNLEPLVKVVAEDKWGAFFG